MTKIIKSAHFINGEWVCDGSDTCAVINPADETLIGEAPMASREEIEHAITSARIAFDSGLWPRMSMQERVVILERMHAYLVSKKSEIVRLIVAEAGATQALAEGLHFDIPMKHAKHLLAEALHIRPDMTPYEITPSLDGTQVLGLGTVEYEPIGVVSAITPYNFPFFLNVVKVYHALTMGNTVILKPSPLTPYQAFILGDAAEAAGLPKGVLNIVNGDIAAGELLTTDPRVDMVTFTGSDKVGAAIVAQAAPTLKKTHMELGGKSALIVRQDADLDAAAVAGLAGFTIHSGQGCSLTTRHLVHNSLRSAYVEKMAQYTRQMRIGNPIDPGVTIGPLIREAARARVERFVDLGLESGAKLITGGRRPLNFERGFFYEPTIFDQVNNDADIARNEIFGPVAVVIGFDTDEEAIRLANTSDFGLGGAVFSRNVGLAYEMAKQLRTGGVVINEGPGTMLSGAPFGGYKRSGFGREYGRQGLLDFTQTKSIAFRAA